MKRSREVCPLCKRSVAMTLNGTFRLHDTKRRHFEQDSKHCDASGRTPEEVKERVHA